MPSRQRSGRRRATPERLLPAQAKCAPRAAAAGRICHNDECRVTVAEMPAYRRDMNFRYAHLLRQETPRRATLRREYRCRFSAATHVTACDERTRLCARVIFTINISPPSR
ncbi:hypothetical protein AVEN_98074-1 [Araneus ventricosus]|uniref:Uncharacterized protein n=1 Tax=Araneus ventricosus TaxID=182803 RepID=A0A4Y2MPN0_ARAVE|nr:hypothetical protein AVEN_98074-1 [Araneus ventricosus]